MYILVLQVLEESAWELRVAGIQQPVNCPTLSDVTGQLLCVDDVMNLVTKKFFVTSHCQQIYTFLTYGWRIFFFFFNRWFVQFFGV